MPPEKRERRVHMNFLVGPKGKEWVEALAKKHDITQGDVMRACLTIARRHDTELARILNELEAI